MAGSSTPLPADNQEFSSRTPTGEWFVVSTSRAFGEMDLLTAVMHELGRFDEAKGKLAWPGANLLAGYRDVKFYPGLWERSKNWP
jgi:hypothetical protein